MRRIPDDPLWLGHVGDARDAAALRAAGIAAVVDLALNEPPAQLAREFASLRFPLIDGEGNPPWLLRAAVDAVAGLLRDGVPTLVYCGAGMSRTPAVAGAALARVRGLTPAEGLRLATQAQAADVSPALWADVVAAVS